MVISSLRLRGFYGLLLIKSVRLIAMSSLPLHLEINEWLLNQCPSVVSYFFTGLPVTLHADEQSVTLLNAFFLYRKSVMSFSQLISLVGGQR